MADVPSSAISASQAAAASKSAAQSATVAGGNAIKAAEAARASKQSAESAGSAVTDAQEAAVAAGASAASAASSAGSVLNIATATPTANKIPIARGDGTLDPGWGGGGGGGGSGVTTFADQATAAADSGAPPTPGSLAWITDKGAMYVAFSSAAFETMPTTFTEEMFPRNDAASVWVRHDFAHLPYQAHSAFWIGPGDDTAPVTNDGLTVGAPTHGIARFARRFGNPETFARVLTYSDLSTGDDDPGMNPAIGGCTGDSNAGFSSAASIWQSSPVRSCELSPDVLLCPVVFDNQAYPYTIVNGWVYDGGPEVNPASANVIQNCDNVIGIAMNGAPGNGGHSVVVKKSGVVPVRFEDGQDANAVSLGAILYLSDAGPGWVTPIPPSAPSLVIPIGRVHHFENSSLDRSKRIVYVDLSPRLGGGGAEFGTPAIAYDSPATNFQRVMVQLKDRYGNNLNRRTVVKVWVGNNPYTNATTPPDNGFSVEGGFGIDYLPDPGTASVISIITDSTGSFGVGLSVTVPPVDTFYVTFTYGSFVAASDPISF